MEIVLLYSDNEYLLVTKTFAENYCRNNHNFKYRKITKKEKVNGILIKVPEHPAIKNIGNHA